jgi:hypothetical protein
MRFAQLNEFNHTDSTNHLTSNKDLPALNNQYFQQWPDRLRFNSPTSGENLDSTSDATPYGRSELREWDIKKNRKAGFLMNQFAQSFFAARQAIVDVGPAGKSISMQIHGAGDHPVGKLQWKLAKDKKSVDLNFQYRVKCNTKEDQDIILVKGVPFNVAFDLAISYGEGWMAVDYNWNTDKPVSKVITLDKKSYAKDPQYFKSGVYCQTQVVDKNKQLKGQGVVDIFAFAMHHGEKIELPDFDKQAEFKAGEDTTNQKNPAPVPTPGTPEKPAESQNPGQNPVDYPEVDIPKVPAATNADQLLAGVPAGKVEAVKVLIGQINTAANAGQPALAKEALTKLEDIADHFDEDEIVNLRTWLKSMRDAM